MTPEEAAHEIVTCISGAAGVAAVEVRDDPEEDMRSGGYFFEVEATDGGRFTVVVVRSDL